jgi:hypothetical protein
MEVPFVYGRLALTDNYSCLKIIPSNKPKLSGNI